MERDLDDLLIILLIQCSPGRSQVVAATSLPEERFEGDEGSFCS